ncbi:MAG: hypothetical protein V1860_01615 [bacterium]
MDGKTLKNHIIATLSFFHIFQHPLTHFEIHKFLFQVSEGNFFLSHTMGMMEELKKEKIINEKNGFYTLNFRDADFCNSPAHCASCTDAKSCDSALNYAGCRDAANRVSTDEMVKKRMEIARISENKYKKALSIIKILSIIPSIKFIGICNSLSFNNADEKSDIDLFIITEKNKIWRSRLIAAGILKLLRQRPTAKNSTDKICASFFISEDNLNLEKISCHPETDIYLLYWAAALIPIYNREKTYEKFITANLWIKKYLPNWQLNIMAKDRTIKERKIFPFILSSFLCIIAESSAKKIQLAVMPDYLKKMAGKNTNVIINDSMLKFHNNDRRIEYYEKWKNIYEHTELK